MNEPGPMLGGILVFLGSGAGGLIRHLLGSFIQQSTGAKFPIGTLTVNVSGCLVMGAFVGAWAGSTPLREDLRLAILVGVLGGYTTFSSFGRDFYLLAADNAWMRASLYALSSVLLSLLATWAGVATARAWTAAA